MVSAPFKEIVMKKAVVVSSKASTQKLYSLRMRAEILGRKKGISIQSSRGCSTASTDGKVIDVMPAAVSDDPDSVDLLEGLLDHETAHIRHTEFDAKKTIFTYPLALRFYGTLEDGRIELKQGVEYPGTCRTINKALEIMAKKGLFKPPDGSEDPGSLFSNMLLDFVRGVMLEQKVLAPHFLARRALIEKEVGVPLVSKILDMAEHGLRAARSTSDVVKLSVSLADLLSKKQGQSSGSGGASEDQGDKSEQGQSSGSGGASEDQGDESEQGQSSGSGAAS
jgi:hypothetical protein